MKIAQIRTVNTWWAIGSGGGAIAVVLGMWFAARHEPWFYYVLISFVLDMAVFWSFFFVLTSFKKRKWPFLTFLPEYNPQHHITTSFLTAKWWWVYVLPLLIAIVVPIAMMLVQGTNLNNGWAISNIWPHIIIFITLCINNVAYAVVLTKVQTGEYEQTTSFDLKNR